MTNSPIECANCGSSRIVTQRLSDSFVYGRGSDAIDLSAVVPFHRCTDCGFEFTDAEADDARHEAICRHLGVMSPSEILSIREHYGMTRAEFAQKSRIGEASLARWETGQLIQNAANDDYLFLLRFPENISRLEARRSYASISAESGHVSVQRVPRFRELAEASSTPQQRLFLVSRRAV